jgi:hypothetical protein
MRPGFDQRNNRITENCKIRAAADAVDGIGGAGLARVEVRGGAHREVAARGKSHDANLIGRNVPVGRMRPERADRALRVAQLYGMVILWAQAILQNERNNALRVQKIRDLAAFVIHREIGVTAAGANNYSRHSGRRSAREIRGDGGNVLIVGALSARRGA